MYIDNLLKLNGLSFELLDLLSFKTRFGTSLKKELKFYDKDLLFDEIKQMIDFYDETDLLSEISIDYRIKSIDSVLLKYDRYIDYNLEVRKVYNDVLGFRTFCDNYEKILEIASEKIRIVDMTNGKANDDGYRGVHFYYQKDNLHYPIEIQFNTLFDRQLNNWLHDYVYKRNYSNDIGKKLREQYELGAIRTEREFLEELGKCVI